MPWSRCCQPGLRAGMESDVLAPSNDPMATKGAMAIDPDVPSFVGRGLRSPWASTPGAIAMTRARGP